VSVLALRVESPTVACKPQTPHLGLTKTGEKGTIGRMSRHWFLPELAVPEAEYWKSSELLVKVG